MPTIGPLRSWSLLWPTFQNLPRPHLQTPPWTPTTDILPYEIQKHALLPRTKSDSSQSKWSSPRECALPVYCRHRICGQQPQTMSLIKCSGTIRRLWQGTSASLMPSSKQQIPMLRPTGPLFQLGCVFLSRRTLCFHHPILEPAILLQHCLRPIWSRLLTLPGIHIMLSHLQQCKQHAAFYPGVRGYIRHSRLLDSLPSFSNQQNNHNFLADSGSRYCWKKRYQPAPPLGAVPWRPC